MSSEEDDKHENGAKDDATGEPTQENEGEALNDGSGSGSSAALDENTASFKLREAWPQIELEGGNGLVVCTIDVQLLTGK